MQHFIFNKFSTCLVLIPSLFIYSCGGGGSSGSNSDSPNMPGPIQQITIDEFPALLSVNENETVTLSLNPRGEGAGDLTFDWSVEFRGEPLEFSGQNTDSISFVAPEVDFGGSVSVRVDIDSTNVRLFGNNIQQTSVQIDDLNPPSFAEIGATSELPAVNALDLSVINDASTWRLNVYSRTESELAGTPILTEISAHETVYFTGTEETLEQENCGTQTTTLDPFEFSGLLNCDGSQANISFFQQGTELRVELSCPNNSSFAAFTYSLVDDSMRNNFGDLSIEFETRNNLEQTTAVCGITAVSRISEIDTNISVSSTSIRLETEYEGAPFSLFLFFEGEPTFGRKAFNSEFNRLEISSDVLPGLSGGNTVPDVFSDITLLSTSSTDIEGSFEASIEDTSGEVEDIEGSFSLRFE